MADTSLGGNSNPAKDAAEDSITASVSAVMKKEASPGASGDESALASKKSWQLEDVPSPHHSARSSTHAPAANDDALGADELDDAGELPSMPVQKRRRVTRACDECRRKKIKCDGKQPCTHCSVYSYECTYDKPSNRRRNPAPQYIEALENRLQRAEALLRKFMPECDLTDPDLDPLVQQEFRTRNQARAQGANPKSADAKVDETKDSELLSMIQTMGQLDLTDGGEWDFHGISSGAVFLRRMKEHFGGLLGNDYKTPFLPRPPRPAGMLNLDSPMSSGSSPWDSSNSSSPPNVYDLPPKEMTRNLCYYSLNCATCLLRIVHIPSFYCMVDRLYEKLPETYGHEDNRSLALLYAVMALGCMYNIPDDNANSAGLYKPAMEEGLKYYNRARRLLQDITECRDIASLQALIFMIQFLQSTSNLSGCYSFIGIALRSALRMGLHRDLPLVKLNPIEIETRRRLFYNIRQMDIYVSAMLGFPLLLHNEDIDQSLPSELDDEYITKDGYLEPPPNTPSFFEAFNAHVKLIDIMAKIVKLIYPLRGIELKDGNANVTYKISYPGIKEVERELHEWYERLPPIWHPSPDGSIEVVRVRQILRFSYAHVQLVLYRPFLHYVSPRLASGKNIDDRHFACAAAGMSVSRNIIHIGSEIRKQGVLIGPYWFITYTEYFAILSLVFYAIENPGNPGSAEMLAAATAGKETVASMAHRSLAAERVTTGLNVLFDQLPERLRKLNTRPAPTKKRSIPVPGPSGASVATSHGSDEMSRSHPRLSSRASFGSLRDKGAQDSSYISMPDYVPVNMPTCGTPDSRSAHAASQHLGPGASQHSMGPISNSLYKLDAMMFPSGDPFAYPNQPPLVDMQQRAGPSSASMSSHHHGPSQFFVSQNMYEDIEGQLLGPGPPYFVQSPPNQGGLELSQQLYNVSSMLPLQQGQSNMHSNHQHPHGHQSHQGERELEELLHNPGLKNQWQDVFGNNYRPM